MATPAEKMSEPNTTTIQNKSSDSTINAIRQRRSQELIIGLCGAIGSSVKSLKRALKTQFKQNGYQVEDIRLSDLIAETQDNSDEIKQLTGYQRHTTLQDLGDQLRQTYSNSIVAELAIREISLIRSENIDDQPPSTDMAKNKIAYIVDQLKHPDEIELFRETYRNNFYLIGLLRTEDERKANLKSEQIDDLQISGLISRDRKSDKKHGQQVEASLHKADYFIRNIDVAEKINQSVLRFIRLVHGVSHITPTKDEIGMYSAQSASLRSACLSRQVGAAIADEEGVILATGCNDVPKFGGGLYNSESTLDKRCFNHSGGECHNDKHKSLLKNEIERILENANVADPQQIAATIMQDTKAKSLIEYSRAIHAEMDVLMTMARSENSNSKNKTLYCTTYPCHNCARHIVAAGIRRVVYVEPYEKSLAMQLHGDAICHPETHIHVRFQEEAAFKQVKLQLFFNKLKGRSSMTYATSVQKLGFWTGTSYLYYQNKCRSFIFI